MSDEERDEAGRLVSVVVDGQRFHRADELVAENERMAATLSDVFCEITGGRLSYPTYDARTIITEVNDRIDEYVREGIAEAESVADRLRGVVQAAREAVNDQATYDDVYTELSLALGTDDSADEDVDFKRGLTDRIMRHFAAALAAAADAPQPSEDQR